MRNLEYLSVQDQNHLIVNLHLLVIPPLQVTINVYYIIDTVFADSSVNTSDSSQVESESENDSEIERQDEAEVDPVINDTVNFSIIKKEPGPPTF